MKRTIVMVSAAILLITAGAFADTVLLKSGEELKGIIVERTQDAVKLDVGGMQSAYSLDEIELINGEVPVIFSGQLKPDISIEIGLPAAAVKAQGTSPAAAPAIEEDARMQAAQPPAETMTTITVKPQPAAAQRPVATPAAIWTAVAILLLFLSFYIYSALCLFFIANKTAAAPAWLAWIPVANLFLMCKIASLTYWWILVLLLSLLPYVGAFVSIGFFGFIWYRIALARNKPGWIGILAVVPVLNLFIYGYLAFSNSGTPHLKDVSLPPKQPKPPVPPTVQSPPPPPA